MAVAGSDRQVDIVDIKSSYQKLKGINCRRTVDPKRSLFRLARRQAATKESRFGGRRALSALSFQRSGSLIPGTSSQNAKKSRIENISANTRAGVNARYANTLQVVLAAKFAV